VLARAGVASRRAAEALIVAGRVRVDGRVVSERGVRVDRRARVELDGRRVVAEPLLYIVLHKPRGVVSTLSDPEGRPSLVDYLKNVGARVVPVGRLDFHTSGALLCSNDGEFASRLAHPRYHAQKEYVAKVRGVLDDAALERFRERIEIDGKVTRPAEVELLRVEGDKTWIAVRLEEGKNRQVRRLGDHAGFPVLRLVRVSHAGVTTEDLKPGEWRHLDADELALLQSRYGVPRRVRPAPPSPPHGAAVGGPKLLRPRARPFAQKGNARGGSREGTDSRGERPNTRGERPNTRGERPNTRGERPNTRGERPNTRGERPNTRGERPNTRGGRPNTRGERPNTRGERPNTRGERPNTRGERPNTRGERPNTRGERPSASGARGFGRRRGT
jgi:23S rRNA pseudouridine2605 synthase